MLPGRDGSWAFVSATTDHLVGLGGGAHDGDAGEAIDLASGDTTSIPSPPGEGFDEILSVASTADHVVVVGAIREDDRPVQDEAPVRARRVSYRYDPASREWDAMPLPDVLARSSVSSTAELVAGGPTGVAGAFPVSPTSEVLAVADDDGWRVVADGLEPTRDAWCATTRDWWVLSAVDHPEERDPSVPYPATLTLRARPFDGSPPRQVETPPLLTEFGGAGVELGCVGDVVALMVGSGGEAEAGLHVLDGDRWRTTSPPTSAGWLPSSAESGTTGPIMTYVPFEEGGSYEDRRPIEGISVSGDGEVHTIPGTLQDVALHLAAASSTLVVLGPVPGESGEQVSVPLRLVEIGS